MIARKPAVMAIVSTQSGSFTLFTSDSLLFQIILTQYNVNHMTA
jgi:hypothetical protein